MESDHDDQDDELQCSCPAECYNANAVESIGCLAVIGGISYSIHQKLDLGADLSKQMLTKLGFWFMSPVPNAVLDKDSQVILNVLTAVFVVGILAVIKAFLTMQLRVPGLK